MSRALVLGGGGTTGIAWEAGVLAGLEASGVDVLAADLIIGTSAGSIVGAYLGLGASAQELAAGVPEHVHTIGRLGLRPLARLAFAQLGRDRDALVRHFATLPPATGFTEDAYITAVAGDLCGRPWPPHLIITTMNGHTGRLAALDATSGVDLGRAVAASCAVPGVFPPVHVDGVPHVDGGVRSPANADLAAGSRAVITLAPYGLSREPRRRPLVQLRGLPAATSWLYVHPDRAARRSFGLDALDASRSAAALAEGRRQAQAAASAARTIWG